MEIDLLHTLNLSGLNESTKFCDGLPFLVSVGLCSAAWPSSTTSWSSSVASGCKASSSGNGYRFDSVSHVVRLSEMIRVKVMVRDAIRSDVGGRRNYRQVLVEEANKIV